MEFPIVVRMPYGGGVGRRSCTTTRRRRTTSHAGVKVAIPSTPADRKGILAAAIRDPDPWSCSSEAALPNESRATCRTANTSSAREGSPGGGGRGPDAGGYGSMGRRVEAAADALDDVSVEVLDIRSLKPLDEDALLAYRSGRPGRV